MLCDRVLFLAPGGHVAYFGPPRRAAAFFGRDDFQEVFQDLGAESERDWTGEFQATDDYRRFVADPRRARQRFRPPARPPRSRGLGWRRWWRQFTTLCRRYPRC